MKTGAGPVKHANGLAFQAYVDDWPGMRSRLQGAHRSSSKSRFLIGRGSSVSRRRPGGLVDIWVVHVAAHSSRDGLNGRIKGAFPEVRIRSGGPRGCTSLRWWRGGQRWSRWRCTLPLQIPTSKIPRFCTL